MIEKPCFYQLIPVDIYRHFANNNTAQLGHHDELQLFGLFQSLFYAIYPFHVRSSSACSQAETRLSVSFSLQPSAPNVISAVLSPQAIAMRDTLI